MYYHCRPLKYVEYGTVYPCPEEKLDKDLAYMYKWIGCFSGFYPQVWLSRSRSSITGVRNRWNRDSVMFGFDIITHGFPVAYDEWENVMCFLMNEKNGYNNKAEAIAYYASKINEIIKECKAEGDEDEWTRRWEATTPEEYLNRYLFIEKDQVVVPSLNLKCAKKIICRDEKQKKKLRHMGFIEDRIEIKNLKSPRW